MVFVVIICHNNHLRIPGRTKGNCHSQPIGARLAGHDADIVGMVGCTGILAEACRASTGRCGKGRRVLRPPWGLCAITGVGSGGGRVDTILGGPGLQLGGWTKKFPGCTNLTSAGCSRERNP